MRTQVQLFLYVLVLLMAPAVCSATERTAPVPRGADRFPPPVRAKLEAAFALAHERLRESRRCRDLYRPHRWSGSESLAYTLYVRPTVSESHSLCRTQVVAFTVTGGVATRLCTSFAQLATPRAAAVLLHEALHTAGMPEAPTIAGALSASEIDALVSSRCDL